MRRGCPACQKDFIIEDSDDLEILETFVAHLPFCSVHKRKIDKLIEEKENGALD